MSFTGLINILLLGFAVYAAFTNRNNKRSKKTSKTASGYDRKPAAKKKRTFMDAINEGIESIVEEIEGAANKTTVIGKKSASQNKTKKTVANMQENHQQIANNAEAKFQEMGSKQEHTIVKKTETLDKNNRTKLQKAIINIEILGKPKSLR